MALAAELRGRAVARRRQGVETEGVEVADRVQPAVADQGQQLVAGIFEHVMPGILEAMNFGAGEASHPFVEEMPIEDEIAHAPADHHGHVLQTAELFLHLADQRVARIVRNQWNVLHEAENGDAMGPGIVGGEIAVAHLGRDLAGGQPALLFLLDELLQGTNSKDRRVGAEGLVRGLVDRGAIGLISTHDLALTEISGLPSGHLHNVHFEDEFEDERMKFDYQLREGVVTKSNGLAGLDARMKIDSPLHVRHIENLANMAKQGLFVYKGRGNVPEASFVSGECAMITTSSGFYGNVAKNAKFAYGLAALPYYATLTQTWFYDVIAQRALIYQFGAMPSVAWSVSTEWFFYLAFPLICFAIASIASARRRLAAAAGKLSR